MRILPTLPSRPVPTNLNQKKVMISYSDGEGKNGQVGISIWEQGHTVGRAGVIRVPPDVRMRWDAKRSGGRHNDIFEVEAIGPLLVAINFPDMLADALWLHFVDNEAALSSLVRGGSSVVSGDHLAGLTWSQIVRIGCLPWFDRVDSAANPTDGLSCGRLEGPWILEHIRFPEWICPQHLDV